MKRLLLFSGIDEVTLPYTNNLLLWLTGRIPSFILDGNDINNWADQSGLGNDVSQASAALKPQKTTLSGFEAVDNTFSPTQFLERNDGLGMVGAEAITFFMVIKSTLNAALNGLFSLGDSFAVVKLNGTQGLPIDHELLTTYNPGGANTWFPPDFTTNITLITFRRAAGSIPSETEMWINGNPITIKLTAGTDPLNFDNSNVVVGAQEVNLNSFDGKIGEVIVFNESLSNANREATENSLINAWGIV